jgi:DNA-binding beta-propeller fold protein YncE
VAVDQAGQVYVADTVNNLIRLITPAGVVSTVAGVPGIAGAQDGDPGLATFNAPAGVAVSRNGRWVFVADTGNSTIRFILDPRRLYNGPPPEVRTYAGIPTVSGERDGYDGLLDHPKAIAVDNADDYYQIHVYIADTGNAAIRLASFDNGLETIPLTNGPTTFLETPFSAPATTSDSSSGTGSPVASSAAATTSSSSGGGAFGGQFVLILAGLLLLRRRRATD